MIDKPDGWEWRLTAELMRHLNCPLFQKIKDLRDGLYVKPQKHIDSDEVIKWIQLRIAEVSNFMDPIVGLVKRLNESWGPPGKPGNAEEIHHITILIRDYLEQIIQYEEQILFTDVPEEYERSINLLKDLVGSQAEKLADIPDFLDEAASLIGVDHGGALANPHVFEKTITFDLPRDWNNQIVNELERAVKIQSGNNKIGGCFSFVIGIFIILTDVFI